MIDRFLSYATSKQNVWFARLDEIAKWMLAHREDTPIIESGPVLISDLPGPD